MKNKYSRIQLEELYHCYIGKRAMPGKEGYLYWRAEGKPLTEGGSDRLFLVATGRNLDELHEKIRKAIWEYCIVHNRE